MKLIAETAWHHEGDFIFMKDLVSSISNNTNADIIKIKIFFFVKKTIQTKTKKNLFKIWPMNIAMDLNPLPISFNS